MSPIGAEDGVAQQIGPLFWMHTLTFSPGPLGISFVDGGIVTKAAPQSQADKAGVQQGWFIIKVGARACEGASKRAIELAFNELKKADSIYTVVFAMWNMQPEDALPVEAAAAIEEEVVDCADDSINNLIGADAVIAPAETRPAELDSAARVRQALLDMHALKTGQEETNDEDRQERLLETRKCLAQALFDDGKQQEGLLCLRKVLAEMEQSRNSPAMLDGYLAWALMLGELGRNSEALGILRTNAKAHVDRCEGLPFALVQALAWNMWTLGEDDMLDDAEELILHSLRTCDHDGMIAVEKHNLNVILANVLNKQGRHKEELVLRQAVLEAARREHGEDAPLTKQVEEQYLEAQSLAQLTQRSTAFWRIVLGVGVVAVAWIMSPK